MIINLTKVSKAEDDVIFEHLFDGKTGDDSKITYNTVSLTPTLDLISLSINDDTTDLITRVFAIDVTNGNLTIIADSSNNLQISQNINCDILTIGQYIRPSKEHLPVDRYYSEEEFEELKNAALELGLKACVSAPLARSSYMAKETYFKLKNI